MSSLSDLDELAKAILSPMIGRTRGVVTRNAGILRATMPSLSVDVFCKLGCIVSCKAVCCCFWRCIPCPTGQWDMSFLKPKFIPKVLLEVTADERQDCGKIATKY